MRNKIITIVLLLSIILLIVAIFFGIDLGNFSILSVSQIKEKNNKLSETIDSAATLITINYPESVSELESNHENYMVKKEEYEQLSGFTTENGKKTIFETKQYDIGYLWQTLGKYSAINNLAMEIDVKASNIEQNLYNLNFKLSGQYVNISEFIVDIENDSDFYFRIYDFKMNGEGEIVNATFTVKNVVIDPETLSAVSTEE